MNRKKLGFILTVGCGVLGISGAQFQAHADPVDAFHHLNLPVLSATAKAYTENTSAWYARWKLVAEAKHSIDMSVFAVHENVFGKAWLGLLLKKAEEGVKIRLLMDSKASSFFTVLGRDYLQELAANPNIQIRAYNPVSKATLGLPKGAKALLASLHDKLLIVDGEVAVTGGRNVSGDYFTDPADDPTSWRDSDVMIRGLEVGQRYLPAFEEEFNQPRNSRFAGDLFGNWNSKRARLVYAAEAMEHWMRGLGEMPISDITLKWQEEERRKEIARLTMSEAGTVDDSSPRPDCPEMYNEELSKLPNLTRYDEQSAFVGDPAEVKVLDKVSYVAKGGFANNITDNVIRLMDATEHELMIQNPYVVFTPKMFAAVKRAHDRGVKITIHTNSPISTDSLFTQAFFVKDWDRITKELPNAKIFVFVGKRKLHSKVFVFDRKLTTIGSYNMDNMSENINSEITSLIHSPALAEQVLSAIDQDIAVSLDLTAPQQIKEAGSSDGTLGVILGKDPAPAAIAPTKTKLILKFLEKLGFLRDLI